MACSGYNGLAGQVMDGSCTDTRKVIDPVLVIGGVLDAAKIVKQICQAEHIRRGRLRH